MGFGGSVIFSAKRGRNTKKDGSENRYFTAYFQAIMKLKATFVVSVIRGCVSTGILIMILPVLTGASYMWFAMPITEFVVMIYAAANIKKYTKAL